MAADTLKSASITNLDSTPFVPVTSGMGAVGAQKTVDDWVACTAVGIATATSTYRMCRFPTNAKIKSLVIATDKALDSNASPTLAIDVNVIFSDSTIDGTPLALQGLIPTTANTGATTTIASYSTPNKIFGGITPFSTQHAVGYPPTEVVYNGIGTTYNFLGISMQPLWQTFGFVDGRGNPSDPGGMFDILLYVTTGSATGVAGNLYARLGYVT